MRELSENYLFYSNSGGAFWTGARVSVIYVQAPEAGSNYRTISLERFATSFLVQNHPKCWREFAHNLHNPWRVAVRTALLGMLP